MKKSLGFLEAEEKKKFYKEIEKLEQRLSSVVIRRGAALSLVKKYASHDKKIVDCGCASGHLLNQLGENGFLNYTGCDFDNYLTNKSLSFSGCDFNFESLPFEDSGIDVLTAFETMEHLENPFHFIRQVHRVLKPGGYFIASMPNLYHIYNRFIFLIRGDMPRYMYWNDHIAMFPRGVFQKTFLQKFDLVETKFVKGEMPYRWFAKFEWPETKLFGRSICWVLRKK